MKKIIARIKGGLGNQLFCYAAARRHGLTVAEIKDWQERFLLGAENALL